MGLALAAADCTAQWTVCSPGGNSRTPQTMGMLPAVDFE
jgi:hypothetical protein